MMVRLGATWNAGITDSKRWFDTALVFVAYLPFARMAFMPDGRCMDFAGYIFRYGRPHCHAAPRARTGLPALLFSSRLFFSPHPPFFPHRLLPTHSASLSSAELFDGGGSSSSTRSLLHSLVQSFTHLPTYLLVHLYVFFQQGVGGKQAIGGWWLVGSGGPSSVSDALGLISPLARPDHRCLMPDVLRWLTGSAPGNYDRDLAWWIVTSPLKRVQLWLWFWF